MAESTQLEKVKSITAVVSLMQLHYKKQSRKNNLLQSHINEEARNDRTWMPAVGVLNTMCNICLSRVLPQFSVAVCAGVTRRHHSVRCAVDKNDKTRRKK